MEGLGFTCKQTKLVGRAIEVSDDRKNLGFVARVVRALGDSKPRWWNRLLAALLAPALLMAGGMLAGKWISAVSELVRSLWWEESTASVVENHGQTSIRYSYQVGDEEFSGTRFFFGDASGHLAEREIMRFCEEHSSDEKFAIFVNPDSPGEAVVQRGLSPKVWLAIPLSLVLLTLGTAAAVFALIPTVAYWWRRRLRERFLEDVPELLLKSIKGEASESKLLFSSMTTVHRGFRLLVWAAFWNFLVLLVVAGGLLLWKVGDERWLYVGCALIPFSLVGLVLGWMSFRRFLGPQPPGIVFFVDGWRPGNSVAENDKVSVHWMSDPDENDSFNSCRVGLGRWPSGQSFRKWKKNHPDWRDSLVDIGTGTVGAHGFDIGSVGRFDGPAMSGEELHLVMMWQEWDGGVRQTSMFLGSVRAEGSL